MKHKALFLSIFQRDELETDPRLAAKLMLNCRSGEAFGPFALDRTADGELIVNCYVSTPAIDDAHFAPRFRLIRDEEIPLVEKLAADLLGPLFGRAITCGHGTDEESTASADARGPKSSVPINPRLTGDGVITVQHVYEDVFEEAGGRQVRLTDLTIDEAYNTAEGECFVTTLGQRIRIVPGEAPL